MLFILATTLVALLATPAAAAQGERIELRADCPRHATDTCFSDLSSLNRWLWKTRKPDAAHPAVVHVGAGEFRGRLTCQGAGFVTLRGAGREQSVLLGSVDEQPFATVRVRDCEALAFEQLTIRAPRSRTGRGKAVYWAGSGSSSFRDVRLEAEYIAWYDDECPLGNGLPPTSTHRFEGVELQAGAVAVFSSCGALRLTDSVLRVTPGPDTYLPFLSRRLSHVAAAVKASHRSRVELEACRVQVDASAAKRIDQSVGLLAGAQGTPEQRGSGWIEMRGGTLQVIGGPQAPTHAARAERRGKIGSATVRLIDVDLDLAPPNAERAGGTGVVEFVGVEEK